MSGIDEQTLLNNLPKFVMCDDYDVSHSNKPYTKHGYYFCDYLKHLERTAYLENGDLDMFSCGSGDCAKKHKITRLHIQEYNKDGRQVRYDMKIYRIDKNYIGLYGRVELEE